MIVRVGERVSPEQAQKLQMIYLASHGGVTFSTGLGIFGLVLLLFYFPYRFACKNIRKFNPTNRDILAMALLIVGNLFLFKLALLVSSNIGSAFPTVAADSYYYLFPFAAGAMMVRILLNSEVALVYCAMMAPLLGILFNSNMFVMVYALLGSIVGAHGVRQCQDRGVIYTAGLKVMVVNLAMGLCFQTLNNSLLSVQTLYVAVFAVVGALLSSMLVSAFTPLFETLFHYTTNIKLLELANLNSPLLRDLMVKAPGTYHHSVVVGNLVEAAAEAIGANPLLARVAAYYHDIGKTAKPLYFIENMHGGENRHDKLSPHMSALILISHVKEGEALAREKRLGQPIIDIIRQHHGTTLIKFFYEKAKTQAESSGQQVDAQEFRYPGPKPQTREAGLVMLADAVEAASRTLINPTPDRIQGMVQKLINRIFSDGQLDECELTLKNLHEIAKSFNRILCAIFHHRIDYPEAVHKGTNGGKKQHADSGKELPEKTPHTAPSAQKTAVTILNALGCPENTELSISIVGDRAIHRLNREYLGKDRPTNVISFSLQEGAFGHLSPALGDVVISADTAAREAEAAEVSSWERVAFLLLHGILHLTGYDHERSGEAEARRMVKKEKELYTLLVEAGLTKISEGAGSGRR